VITTANMCLKNDLCCSWYNELYDDDDDDDYQRSVNATAPHFLTAFEIHIIFIIYCQLQLQIL